MQEEIWKDIPDYKGLYQVSSLGNVRRLERLLNRKNKGSFLLKESAVKGNKSTGYLRVNLSKDGSSKKYLTHRLVAISFIENIKNKPCVNHIDGNKLNNNINNLEWCTYSENSIHALNSGLFIPKKGEEHHNIRSISRVNVCGPLNKVIYFSIQEASDKTNINVSRIRNVLNGRTKSTGGFVWKYI